MPKPFGGISQPHIIVFTGAYATLPIARFNGCLANESGSLSHSRRCPEDGLMRMVYQFFGSSAIIVLAVGLTIASLQFVRPSHCQRVCMEPTQAPCPDGTCRFGEP